MVRVLTGISILWFLVPGYAVALAMMFVVPRTFTAIAFDSGGVASGPLTATFMLPFAMGRERSARRKCDDRCVRTGGAGGDDAADHGTGHGGIYVLKSKRGAEKAAALPYDEREIIELWEAC